MFRKFRHIHFVGIGGIGMSGIAEVLLNLGYRVSGSDAASSPIIQRLGNMGARVSIGHARSHITEDIDVVVASTAVKKENIEVIAAKEKKIPVIPRAEMLAELMRLKYGVAIAGTHGKTTTTSMIATILSHANLDPTIVIGGRLNILGSNAKLGQGDLLIAEADESDGSFLKLSPTIAVVTTIDEEHLDHYGNLDVIQSAFLEFINKVPFYGAAIICLDEENIQAIIPLIEKKIITYGFSSQADLNAADVSFSGVESEFTLFWKNQEMGRIKIQSPGFHNVLNALGAIGVAFELDVDFETVQAALKQFTGADRRFQIKADIDNIMIVDDYAHHPVEIRAALAAAKQGWNRRVIALFQPHRYTRTQALLNDFFTAFYQADVLIVTEIYPAGESPIEGVEGKRIANGVQDHGHRQVFFVSEFEEIVEKVREIVQPGDMVITLGAGNIYQVGEKLIEKLKGKQNE